MSRLLAEQFHDDPRVQQAKRLILDAMAEHQADLSDVRPGDPERKQAYDDLIEQFGRLRGGSLYYPYLGSGFGRGALVELADGSVKYDFITGIGVHYFGHNHPAIVEAGLDAAIRDTVIQGNLQQNVESVELSRMLIDTANRNGAALNHCFLTSSGAMANENALKLIFQKKQPANRILAFSGAFSGRTLAMSQITDKAAYRAGLPTVLAVDYVPFFDPADPDGSTRRALTVLHKHLERYPGKHAGMIMELVLGEGGYHPGDRGFFTAIMQLLKDRGIAILVDEIQTFGRTTEPFAFQLYGLDEFVDVATVGKLTQVCATLFRDEFTPKPGLISQTFTGTTASIYAARAIIGGLLDGGFFGNDGKIAQFHQRFTNHLETIAQRHPDWIKGPFGIGAMIAFTPFDGTEQSAKKIAHALFDAGVISFTAGSSPARVRFLIPVGGVTEPDIDTVCRILEQTLTRVAQAA
jgi:4-aminobutyrate aminotransferase-like enzyme